MKQCFCRIESNIPIADNTFEMVLSGDTSAHTRPGQFVNIKLDGFFLRRPISVCDYDENGFTLIYKAVGQGTRLMSGLKQGTVLDVLTGLGNGFDIAPAGSAPLLIGGGAGVPPMYSVAKALLKARADIPVTAVLGFNTEKEIFYRERFEALGVRTLLCTVDGSAGIRGFVTDGMKRTAYTHFFCCGPEPMLRAIDRCAETSGQFSFEERMGCGFGACMGCTCKTKYGSKRICKDGPVLMREEIVW